MAAIVQERWQSRMASTGDAILYLFNNPLLPDITFSCLDSKGVIQQIHAHSFVLMIRSPLFYDELDADIKKQQVILIVEYTYEIFLSFTRYLYGAEFVIDAQNASQLCNIGQRYEVEFLVNRTIEFIANVKLSLENICEYLELSLKIKNQQLKVKVVEFISVDGPESFKSISPDALMEILSQEDEEEIVDVSKMNIFESAMQWTKHRCHLNKYADNPINMQRSLDDLIKLVRFTVMTPKKFAECTRKYDANEFGFLMPRSIKVVGKKDLSKLFQFTAKTSKKFTECIKQLTKEELDSTFDEFQFEVLKNLLPVNKIDISTGRMSWLKCSSNLSKFVVSAPIYVTQVMVAKPYVNQNVRVIVGVKETVLYEQTQMDIDEEGYKLNFTKALKLSPDTHYFCEVKFDYPNVKFYSCEPKKVPYIRNEDNITITFSEWSPLLARVYFKTIK